MSPVDVEVGFPDVRTAAGEAKGLESHGLQRHIACEDHQIGPGDFFAVFLLDRPQQTPRPIEVDVVRPAVEWGKTLLPSAAASATVERAIGTGAVPSHANKQRAIV